MAPWPEDSARASCKMKRSVNNLQLLSDTLAELKQTVGNYGNVIARRKGVLGQFEHLIQRGLRKLILRHLDQEREINRLVVHALDELVTHARAQETLTTGLQEAPTATPVHYNLTAYLALAADPEYAVERNRLRQS